MIKRERERNVFRNHHEMDLMMEVDMNDLFQRSKIFDVGVEMITSYNR
jgi:hypothetical protein